MHTRLEESEYEQIQLYLKSLKVYPRVPKKIVCGSMEVKCREFKLNRPVPLDRVIFGLLQMRVSAVFHLNWLSSHTYDGSKESNLMRADLFRLRIESIDNLIDSFGYEIL